MTVTKELAVDLATGAVVGEALGKEETAEGVERVLVQATAECQHTLAILSDNGSANRAAAVQRVSNEKTELGQIFSFPYHPRTNGRLEGIFGRLERLVGDIILDDSSRQTLAACVVGLLWRLFIHFTNHSPRKELGGLGPLEYFRRYAPTPEEVDRAREGLKRRQHRSEDLRRPHPRLSDPRFRKLVEDLLTRHRFEEPLERALKALLHYDEQVIRSASAAFFVASERDGFDERKRTFAYFVGIAKNKQKELDAERLRYELTRQASERHLEEARARERELAAERAEEERALREAPEDIVLKYARLLLVGKLGFMRRTWTEKLDTALRALAARGAAPRATLERLATTIRSWGEFTEALKDAMVALLFERAREVWRAPRRRRTAART